MPPCKEAEHESTGEAYFSRCKQYQEVLSKGPSTSFWSSCWWIGSMKCWMVIDPKRRPLSTFLGDDPDSFRANVTKTIFRFWASCIVDARVAIALSLAFEQGVNMHQHQTIHWPALSAFGDWRFQTQVISQWIAWRQARTNAKSLRPTSAKTQGNTCHINTCFGVKLSKREGTLSRTIRTKLLAGGCKPSCSKPTIIACFQLFSVVGTLMWDEVHISAI